MKTLWGILLAAGLMPAGLTVSAQTWTQTSAPTNTTWNSTACSANGKYIIASGGFPFTVSTSTNSGATWMTNNPPWTGGTWVSASAEGRFVAAVTFNSIYISTNFGSSWIPTGAPTNLWRTVASSADGNELVAAVGSGGNNLAGNIYISTNAGLTWAATSAPTNDWNHLSVSANGNKLAAAPWAGMIFISTNAGATWDTNNNSPSLNWTSIASSANGDEIAAVAFNNNAVFVSANYGLTWSSNNLVPKLQSVALSADSSRLVVLAQLTNVIFLSTNHGTTWINNDVPKENWYSAAISADGGQLFAAGVNPAGPGGVIYSSSPAPNLGLNIKVLPNCLTLCWNVPSLDLVLTKNQNLNFTNWLNVTNTPTLNFTSLQNQVSIPLPAENYFFKLKVP
jgi:photosystem II stability/assembly factor-like uncharacterized protein